MNLLVISTHWDLSESDGTSAHMIYLIRLFRALSSQCHLLIAGGPNRQTTHPKLQFDSITVFKGFAKQYSLGYCINYNPDFQRKLRYVMKTNAIYTIYIPFPWGVHYIRHKYPNIQLIYGAHGFEREFAKISWKQLPFIIRSPLSHIIGMQERNAVSDCDLMVAVGDLTAKEIIKNYGIDANKVIIIKPGFDSLIEPMTHSKQTLEKYGLDPQEKHLIFHGGLEHLPNLEAVNLIRNKIAPKVWEKDKSIKFCIVGRGNIRESIRNVETFPFIEDLDEFIQKMTGAVMPILSGSGIRVKAIDYIRNQIPIITTKKGIEGYGISKNEMVITPNQIDSQFIQGILRVCNDPLFSKQLIQKTNIFVEKELTFSSTLELLKRFLIKHMLLKPYPE